MIVLFSYWERYMSSPELNNLEAPGKSYQRIPNRVLDMRDFEVNTTQSKSYNRKQYMTTLVRESETWLILFQNSMIQKNMVGGDDNRTPWASTTYRTSNWNKFNFSRYFGNDGNWAYLWLWNVATAYVVGNVVEIAKNYYYCIQNNTNQIPPNATYWIEVGSGQLSNAWVLSVGSNIVEIINDWLYNVEFGFAMTLQSNIWWVSVSIVSDINWLILTYQITWWAVTPILSDSIGSIDGYKSKQYYAVAGEQLELIFTVVPSGWAGDFTLLDETYRTVSALRPNW